MAFTEEQIGILQAKLDKSVVKSRKQSGRDVSYIEGWHAIAEANRIFGFDGWDRETVELIENTPPTKNANGNFVVSFRAKVRLTVGSTTRDGTGFGSGIARDIHDAYESAVKEAETDAMKRAFMTFGNPFGLALYDKTQTNVEVVPEHKPVSAAEMKRGLETITQELLDCRTPNDAQKIWKAWADVFKEQRWSDDYIGVARDRIQARGRELKAALDAEDKFPGDLPSNLATSHQRPLNA